MSLDSMREQMLAFMSRLALHAPRHMAQAWPKNIISILCQQVLELRMDVDALKRDREARHE